MIQSHALDREAIYTALFALAATVRWDAGQGSVGFKRTTRRIALFPDVPAMEQPWLGQAEHNEYQTQMTGQPYKHTLEVSWMVYHKDGEQPGSVPAILTNLIITAIEKALEPKVQDPGFVERRNTLQGLVHHCFIDGTILKDPGDIDKQALILVPIKILVP